MIKFLHEAEFDILESTTWYASRDSRAAIRFQAAVDHALEQIERDPAKFMLFKNRCQSCRLKKFPFQVIFKVTSKSILIVAVAHGSRHPDFLEDRLSEVEE